PPLTKSSDFHSIRTALYYIAGTTTMKQQPRGVMTPMALVPLDKALKDLEHLQTVEQERDALKGQVHEQSSTIAQLREYIRQQQLHMDALQQTVKEQGGTIARQAHQIDTLRTHKEQFREEAKSLQNELNATRRHYISRAIADLEEKGENLSPLE
ncbi:MAG: hypothetical protein CUN55_18745, partial [Phototrophicales bacterium]